MLKDLFNEDQPGENAATSALMFGVGALIMTATLVGALAGAGFGVVAMGIGLNYFRDEEFVRSPKFERMAKAGIILGAVSIVASIAILLIRDL